MKSFTICLVVKYYFLCLGSSLLVKPITEQGSVGTSVYFPGKDEVSFRINTDCFSNACTSWLIGNSYPYTCTCILHIRYMYQHTCTKSCLLKDFVLGVCKIIPTTADLISVHVLLILEEEVEWFYEHVSDLV